MPSSTPITEERRKLLDKYFEELKYSDAAPDPIPRRLTAGPAPLSYAQQQVWIHSLLAPDVPVYNEPLVVYRHGLLDVAALERAFTEIVHRHEVWRTTIEVAGGEPRQVIHPPQNISLPFMDLSALPADAREDEAQRLGNAECSKLIDLHHG